MMIYCEKCQKELNHYDVVECEIERRLKGIPYKFNGKEALCPDCGSVIFVSEISEYNQERLYETYRKTHDLISLNDILSIQKKYHISKRNISKYLGWGEVTFQRYCIGYLPTKQNSDILREIVSNPEFLMDKIVKYIQEHPDDSSAKNDLQKLMGCETVAEQNKIFRVSEYIIKKLNKVLFSRLQLMKLLYYVQGFNKSINGVFMFNDDCQAWQYGPVYPNVRDKFSDLEIDSSVYLDEIDINKLDLEDDEKAIIDGVLAAFERFKNNELINMTHNETPWKNARVGIPEGSRSENIITKDDIASFFEKVVKDYNINDASEIVKYTQGK